MASRYPQWKVEMFRTRKWNIGCTCRALIPGVMSERRDPSCPVHGWEGDEEAVGEPNCDGGGTVNDARLYRLGREANLVVAAWGADPAAFDRGRYVRGLLGDCVALGLTKHGHPRHPLYVKADAVPVPYPGGER